MRAILADDGARHRDMYWPRDSHFNVYGNRVYANAVKRAYFGDGSSPCRGRAEISLSE